MPHSGKSNLSFFSITRRSCRKVNQSNRSKADWRSGLVKRKGDLWSVGEYKTIFRDYFHFVCRLEIRCKAEGRPFAVRDSRSPDEPWVQAIFSDLRRLFTTRPSFVVDARWIELRQSNLLRWIVDKFLVTCILQVNWIIEKVYVSWIW